MCLVILAIDLQFLQTALMVRDGKNPDLKGQTDYTIKVDNKGLVFLMWMIAPEYTWTCLDQPYNKYFSKQDCLEQIPPNCKLEAVNDSRVWVDKTLNYPSNW